MDEHNPEIAKVHGAHRDLLEYLFEQWDSERSEAPPPALDREGNIQALRIAAEREIVKAFVIAAREILSENQPVSTSVLDGPMSLVLQDMTHVPIVDAEVRTTGGDAGSVPVTQPKEKRFPEIQMQPAPSFGITGNDDKKRT